MGLCSGPTVRNSGTTVRNSGPTVRNSGSTAGNSGLVAAQLPIQPILRWAKPNFRSEVGLDFAGPS